MEAAFWLLCLTSCSVSGVVFGRVKTGLRHISVPFTQKSMANILCPHTCAKAHEQPERVKLTVTVYTDRLFKGFQEP